VTPADPAPAYRAPTRAPSETEVASGTIAPADTNGTLAAADNSAASAGGPGTSQTGQSSSSSRLAQAPSSAQFIDFQAVNQQDEKLGTVEVVWEDTSGGPAYLGVKQPAQEKLAVIPAEGVQVNQSRKSVRLNLSSQALQAAPTVEEDAELDQQLQEKAQSFYRQHTAKAAAGQVQPRTRRPSS
jgi:hypothetical protein